MATRPSVQTALYASTVIGAVLVLLPFHALLTTWIGSNTGHLDAVRIWKEVVVVALVPVTSWLIAKDKVLKTWFWQNWLPRLMLVYVLLHVILGILALQAGRVNAVALIYGLLANLRFLGFFLIAYVVSSQSAFLKHHWKTIVIIPAMAVIGFGILQRFLPYDFLRHFGYGPKTIPAYQTVDQKLDYRRIQSTLRGANPLGAYLVLTVPLIATIKRRKIGLGLLVAALGVLVFTYSRSAWIGVLLTLITYGYLSIASIKLRKQLAGLLITLALLSGLTVGLLRHNSVAQNVFFHTDNTSRSAESSNTGRTRALEDAAREVLHEPFGRGPGTAGPASVRNSQPARIAENYYLQIGQEVGWVGMVLFVAMITMVGYKLWRQRSDDLSRALLAALIGISFVNLLSHAWADDTLGLLWWGLAGIALAPLLHSKATKGKAAILNIKRKQYAKTQEKPTQRS